MNKISNCMVVCVLLGTLAGCDGPASTPHVSAATRALADTPEERRVQAGRYLEAMPTRELMDDMTKNMAGAFPMVDGSTLDAYMDNIDYDTLNEAVLDAMVKNFTAEEIRALAEFYGSPVGKSAMGKMGPYMADLMPIMMEQLMPGWEAMMAAPK